MRNYLIVVEGAHDIAVVERLLILNGIEKRISDAAELPSVWKHTIPTAFPFKEGRLDRITPIPSFLKNEEVSVAIKNANSDTEIMPVLQQIMDTMLVKEKDQIDSIMLLCDADQKKAEEKIEELLKDCKEKEDFKISTEKGQIILDLGIKKVPVYTYAFPNNENEGNLENLLLETAQVAYPELLKLAETYIDAAAKLQEILQREQYAKKAKVGCIANTMKPGKANQVSIANDRWISDDTLQKCYMLQKLNIEICKMLTPPVSA